MNKRAQTPIDELANSYVQALLDLSPELVTHTGASGADEGAFDDYSLAGIQTKVDLDRSTLAKLGELRVVDDVDAVTANALRERLGLKIELAEAGEIGELNVISTPLQGTQEIFDLMNQETSADWELIAERLSNVRSALEGWKETLLWRAQSGPPTAVRQVDLAAEQASANAGSDSPLTALVDRGAGSHPGLEQQLRSAADDARSAYGELSEFLRTEIAQYAVARDAFGRERYGRALRQFIGASPDLDETYSWGIHELERIISEQEKVSAELYGPGVLVREAMDRLNNDPARQIHGKEALKEWMQSTSDAAVRALQGTHFEIPAELEKLECMIAPSGTGAIYYTGPTEDFSRGGRMWWSVPEGSTTFTTWQEKTTVYHEGVPGHHLQIGYATYLKDQLNSWRRQHCWVSGHGEGWALYAEGLMRELGFMDEPGDYMGILDAERLRAARVVLDIGVHLEKPSPEKYREISPIWNRDVAWEFLKDNVAMDRSFLLFELNRYLGWAGQAPSYKVGHRMWQQLRSDAQERAGVDFDLKAWHTKALSMGSVGLDVLGEALAR